MKLRYVAALALLALLSACGDKVQKPPYGGLKIGKPYQVYGRWYKPRYESDYDEIGKASWYGPGFHGGKTANGERFDQNDMTAAHRTLPLPSIVRVTNLENGKSAIVRVNDRGPFAHDRILDLSKAAATQLDVIRMGTAKVRVQFLEKETKEYVQNTYGQGAQFAKNELKQVDPVEAGKEQDAINKVEFVPQGETPPPGTVPMTKEVMVNYSGTDIFAVVDKTNPPAVEAEVADEQVDSPPPAPAKDSTVHYLNTEAKSQTAQASGAYSVQLGTFASRENAQRLADKLGGQYDAHVLTFTSSANRELYRVVVGPYKDMDTAKNMLSKLGAVGMADAKVIRN